METERRLEHLLAVAAQLGLEVRREALGGSGGGVCKLKGNRVLFVDTSADAETRYERVVASMASLPEMADRHLPPAVREDLDRAANSARNPSAAPGP